MNDKKKISIRSTLKFQTISLAINHYKVIERKNPNTGTYRVNFEYFPTFLYRACGDLYNLTMCSASNSKFHLEKPQNCYQY